MDKRLTLDEAWTLCLEMYKWIVENWIPGVNQVCNLKKQWLTEHGYAEDEVELGCFFCEYGARIV